MKKASQQLRSRVVDEGKSPLFEGNIRSLRTRVVVAEIWFPCSNQLVGNPLCSKLERRSSSAGDQNPEVKDRETGRWVVVQGSMTELSRFGGFVGGFRGEDGGGGRSRWWSGREAREKRK